MAAPLDPHAQNENVTNQIAALAYETLLTYDKQMKLTPALAVSVGKSGRRSSDQGVPPAPRREVPRRHALHGGRRDLLLRAREDHAHRVLQALLERLGRRAPRGRPHGGVHHRQPQPDRAQHRRQHLRDEQALVREEQHGEAPGHPRSRGDLLGAQRQRHGSVHPRVARRGREDRLPEESRLVGNPRGPLRGQRGRSGIPAGHERAHAPRGAEVRRAGFRPRSAGAGHPASSRGCGAQGVGRRGDASDLPGLRPGARRVALLRREGEEPLQGPSREEGALSRDRHRGDAHPGDARPLDSDGRPAALSRWRDARTSMDKRLPYDPAAAQAPSRRRVAILQRLRLHSSIARTTATSTTRRSARRSPPCGPAWGST